jgi:tripartite-type tricarboxylate transporter receptor subunit TctC
MRSISRLTGKLRLLTVGAFALLAGAVAAPEAKAQADFPNKPIRIIVGFAAGGGNDLFARVVGQRFSELIGQPVIVENKVGAGGRLASEYTAREAPDGYTILVGASGQMSIAAAIYPDLSYHPTKTFIPLTNIASFPLIMVVKGDNPAKSVSELVTWAKANPDKANYGTSSPAFTIVTELLKLKTGMPAQAIPYKSSNESVLSVVQGQTLLTISDGPPVIPMIRGGQVKVMAVTGAERSSELPDAPSMKEAGYPEVNSRLFSGFFVVAGTPAPIVKKLEENLRKAIADPTVREKLKAMAVDPDGGPGTEFAKIIDRDIEDYKAVVKAANLKFEK